MNTLNQIREHTYLISFQKGLLSGPKIDEIDLPSTIANQLADRIIFDFELHHPFKTIQDIKNQLMRGFIYMFDKGIEIAYFSRVSQLEEIEYDLNDLINGFGGDKVPAYIQESVTPATLVLAEIYSSTIQFIEQNEANLSDANVDAKEVMKLILVGGAFLGIEFCSRIEIE